MLGLLKQLISEDIDIDRIKTEDFPRNYKSLLNKRLYGAIRYCSYIENYSSYDTFREFCAGATYDEVIEMESMYLMDLKYRKYSKPVRAFIPSDLLNRITESQWKQIHMRDIQQFYDFCNAKGWLQF